VPYKGYISDLNDAIEFGLYYGTGASHNPYGNSSFSCAIIALPIESGLVYQKAFRHGEPDKSRWKWSSGVWDSWS
jgi:hypothetical protein